MTSRFEKYSFFAVVIVFVLNLAVWSQTHTRYAKWAGVPPVPSHNGALAFALGDGQFSFRALSIILQNLGDTGGNVTPLRNYDYARLADWFDRLVGVDGNSKYTPWLVGYYFGATTDPEQLKYVVDFLSEVGVRPIPGHWRFLAHAVFLARYGMKDLDLALQLANKLANLPPDEKRPTWTRQMPAFVLTALGEKEAARMIMLQIMETDKTLHPNEYNFMRSFIEERLGLDPDDESAETEAESK